MSAKIIENGIEGEMESNLNLKSKFIAIENWETLHIQESTYKTDWPALDQLSSWPWSSRALPPRPTTYKHLEKREEKILGKQPNCRVSLHP